MTMIWPCGNWSSWRQSTRSTVTPDSPTQRVGGEALTSFAPVHHPVPLESLQDVFSDAEMLEFIDRIAAGTENAAFIVEPKVDGLSIALEYENGVFVRGANSGMARPGGGRDRESAYHPFHSHAP